MKNLLTELAIKQIKKLQTSELKKITKLYERIENAVSIYDIQDIAKLQGTKNLYRIRLGDYRVLIELEDNRIIILAVVPRGSAYRGKK